MKNISDAEYEVMKVIWSEEPVTVSFIVEVLSKKTEWTSRTIRTLINRLKGKGVLGYEKSGKCYLYYSKVTQEECLRKETETFLNKMFDGAMMPMLAHFAKYCDLNEKDIENLKSIVNEKGGE